MKDSNIVVTNLRIPREDWLEVKHAAGELGMSTNSYLNHLIKESSLKRQLGVPLSQKKKQITDKKSFWNLWKELSKQKVEPIGEMKEDDKIIYET